MTTQSVYDTYAPSLVARGLCPLPIEPGGKRPAQWTGSGYALLTAWTNRPPITTPQPGAGIGVRCGEGIVAVDIDTDDEAIGCAIIDSVPDTPLTKRGARGVTLLFRAPQGQAAPSRKFLIDGVTIVEILGEGRQTVLPPTVHPCGRPYQWGNGANLFDADLAALPELPADAAERIEAALAPFGAESEIDLPPPSEDSPYKALNAHAQANIDNWVPKLGLKRCRRQMGRFPSYLAVAAWRPSTTGRPLEQRNPNLKITGKVIYDHGAGRSYSPLDLVMAARSLDLKAAIAWLDEKTGWSNQGPDVDFDAIGAKAKKPKEEAPKEGEDRKEEPKRTRRFIITPFAPIDPLDIPPRSWLLANHYQRRIVSADIADGGVGKSTLNLTEAIVMGTSRPLLGDAPSEAGLRVWVHNGEDDMPEMNRRVLAVCQYYGIPQEELCGSLFLTTGAEIPLKVARGYNDLHIDTRLIRDIVENIMDNKIDVAIFDPLVSLHGTKESDNDKMDQVIRVFIGIGHQANCSINLSHHTRKPPAGSSNSDRTGDDGRGATAVRDAVRGMRVLNPMLATDAAKIGINEMQRTSYVRVDRGKGNYAKPAESAIWRKFESIILPNGDDVGVLTPWQFPEDDALDTSIGALADNTLFLAILDRFTAEGRGVNPTSGPNYAPTVFAKQPEARAAKAGKRQMAAAMTRLFAAGRIRVERCVGTQGRSADRIVRTCA